MSKNRAAIARMVEKYQGKNRPAHYLAFFDCFNRQLFYEAHDVLEQLWLPARKSPEGDFYKGLIQLAGAFVHLQKDRSDPAAALFKLAHANLTKYPGNHEGLDISQVVGLTDVWLERLATAESGARLLALWPPPRIAGPVPCAERRH